MSFYPGTEAVLNTLSSKAKPWSLKQFFVKMWRATTKKPKALDKAQELKRLARRFKDVFIQIQVRQEDGCMMEWLMSMDLQTLKGSLFSTTVLLSPAIA